MFVISETKFKISQGGIVTVHGVGFSESCVVRISGLTYDPIDVSDESLSFAAPDQIGTYSFTIEDGVSTSSALTLYVEAYEDLPSYKLPERGESSFRRMLDSLMPRGFAWDYESGSNWSKLLSGIALSFAYLYGLLKDLVLQMSPFSTTDYNAWERELALPRKGLEQSSTTGRKNEIIRIARKKGGATVPYLRSILNLYGVNFDIYEYWQNPEKFPSWVAAEGDQANFYVLVKIYQDNYYANGFTCKSACNASLGHPRDSILEQILAEEKPAHVKIIYSYVVRVLTDDNGNPLVTDGGQILIA